MITMMRNSFLTKDLHPYLSLVIRDHKDHKENRDLLEILDLLDQRDLQVELVTVVFQGPTDHRVVEEEWVNQDQLVQGLSLKWLRLHRQW